VSSQGTHRDDELGIDDDTRATVDGEELLNNLEINAAEIERRKRHSRFDERDAARLSSIADDVDAVADDIVDEFYDHIDSDPEVRAGRPVVVSPCRRSSPASDGISPG